MINLDKLTAKLEEIRKGKETAQANLNAFAGAEQVLLQLIEEEKGVDTNADNDTD